MSCLVSILIPAYNAEKWLAQTVQSATDQTWENKEVIVVDDGSKDATYEVAKSLQSRNVKVVTQPNAGACAARNKALSLAQGDYIQWLDADDLLHPEKIAHQLARGGARDSRTLLTCAWGKFFFRPGKAKLVPDTLWQDLAPLDWMVTKFADNVWMNPTVWLVSRKLTDLAGPWDTRLAISGDDDGEYICRVVANSTRVEFVREAQCYYRIGSVGSLNWNMERSEASLAAFVLSLRLSIEHLRAVEDSERTRAAAVQYLQTFFPYFYGSNDAMVAELRDLASELGATLTDPKLSWKYRPLELAVGSRHAKAAMNNWRAAKLLAHGSWDKLLLDMGR